MLRNIISQAGRFIALLLTVSVTVSLLIPFSALAAREVGYMPGVTEEMTDPAYWADLTDDPDALLASPEEIARINEAAIATKDTYRLDMRNLKDTYNGIQRNEVLMKSAAEDVKYYLGWVWDQNGKSWNRKISIASPLTVLILTPQRRCPYVGASR